MDKYKLLELFKAGTQKFEIIEYLVMNGSIEVWRLIAPRPTGLGVAQYNARIKEIRECLFITGWEIENDPGKSFTLKQVVDKNGVVNMF